MKVLFIILSSIIISCNAIEVLTGEKSGVDRGRSEEDKALYNDLIGYWNFNEAAGENKSSPHSNLILNIQANSSEIPSKTSSPRGSGLDCDSATSAGNNILESSNALMVASTEQIAISFWAKPNSTFAVAESSRLLAFSDGTFSGVSFYATAAGLPDTLDFEYQAAPHPISLPAGVSSKWSHYVLNIDLGSQNFDLYVDGQFIGAAGIGAGSLSNTTFVACSTFSPPALGEFKGSIDSLGMWRRNLSFDEISYLYNNNTSLD